MFTLRKKKNENADGADIEKMALSEEKNLPTADNTCEEENGGQTDPAEDESATPEPEELPVGDGLEIELGPEQEVPTQEQPADNGEEMMAAFEAWMQDCMPEDERREAAKAAMTMVRASLINGDYDEAMFGVIAKGSDYDRAVSEAEAEGEVKGRNARIDEIFARPEDDGLPHLPSGPSEYERREPSIFDLARGAY